MSDPRQYFLYEKDHPERGGMGFALVILAIFALIMILGGLGLKNNVSDCEHHGGEWVSGHCYMPNKQEVGK